MSRPLAVCLRWEFTVCAGLVGESVEPAANILALYESLGPFANPLDLRRTRAQNIYNRRCSDNIA